MNASSLVCRLATRGQGGSKRPLWEAAAGRLRPTHCVVGRRPVLSRCPFSTATLPGQRSKKYGSTGILPHQSTFAAVDHAAAYEASMAGLHGKQLSLAELEGLGKDDRPFDPFLEEEREEDRQRKLAEGGGATEPIKTPVTASAKSDEDEENKKDEDEDEEDEEDLDEEDAAEETIAKLYNNDGSLRRLKSEKAILRAGAPAGGFVAVIELAGTQHKVTTDDVLIVNRLKPVSTFAVGSTHRLTDVLLLSSSHLTLVGLPYVEGASVEVMVEEITMDAKVIIFKKRRRKNSKRKNGFRRDVTMLRVLNIHLPDSYMDHTHVERPVPALPSSKYDSN